MEKVEIQLDLNEADLIKRALEAYGTAIPALHPSQRELLLELIGVMRGILSAINPR